MDVRVRFVTTVGIVWMQQPLQQRLQQPPQQLLQQPPQLLQKLLETKLS